MGEGSGDVLVTHAPVVSSVVGLGLSLAVVAMKAVIAMKALGTPVVVAGGMPWVMGNSVTTEVTRIGESDAGQRENL